jgi:hypothetical protein
MNNYIKNSLEIGTIFGENRQYPSIVSLFGSDYVISQKSGRHSDMAELCQIKDGAVVDSRIISSPSALVFRPYLAVFSSRLYAAWSEYEDGLWHIVLWNGEKTERIDSGEAVFFSSFLVNSKVPALFFQKQSAGKSEVYLYEEGKGVRSVGKSRKCFRPSGARLDDGSLFVAYDRYNGKSYDVVGILDCGDEVLLSTTSYRSTFPLTALAGSDIVVCWYENGPHSYFSYNSAAVSVKEGRLVVKESKALAENRNWYNNVAVSANANGYAAFAYTIGKYNVLCRIRDREGVWHNPVLLTYNDGMCAVRPSLFLDDENTLHYAWQFAMKNGHQERSAVTVVNKVSIGEMMGYDDLAIESKADLFVLPIEGEKSLGSVAPEVKKAWMEKNGIKGELLFGDIHGQSVMSDGMGEVDQYYHYAMSEARLDFSALTDHDCYPDEATDSEWEYNRAQRNVFDGDENLIVLLAFEWTSNEYMHDFGHKNVYYPGRTGKLFTSVDESGMNPDRLYASIRKEGGICIPHHPAADWGMVSAATDWNYHDEEVEPLVEIFSRHADYEATETTSVYTKNIAKFPRHSMRDALKRGYHLGFSAGSDSHQMEHGVEGGLIAAYLDGHSSASLFEAIRARRTYAVTGDRILLHVTLNGAEAGSFASGEKRKLAVSAVTVYEADKAEVIKNGIVVYSFTPSSNAIDFEWEDGKELEEDYYYVRITEKNGQKAWSSPIWVK